MAKQRFVSGLAAGLVGMALVAAPLQAAETIKVGTFLAVTGPASFLGDPELKTLQMYVDEINAEGGLMGRQIELVHYDSGANPKKAVDFVKRLIQRDKVDVIVGGSASGETMAVTPQVEKAGIPFISLAGSIKIVQPVKKWVFKTPHTDRMAAAKIYEDMNKRGIKKVALISGSGGFDKSGRAQSLDLAPEYGITIVADETYGSKDTDMTAQLTKIRATDAEAILNFGIFQLSTQYILLLRPSSGVIVSGNFVELMEQHGGLFQNSCQPFLQKYLQVSPAYIVNNLKFLIR